MSTKLSAIASVGALLLMPMSARAQVGGGTWTEHFPTFVVQQRGCGVVNDLVFTLTCSDATNDNRAERRYTTYTGTAARQFEGFFRITSMAGTRISLKQTFKDDPGAGPDFMMAVETGGRLYAVHGGATIAPSGTATVGTTVRVNTIHRIGIDHRIYINGSLLLTVGDEGGSHYYDKFGFYRTASGKGPGSVTWSGVRFWIAGGTGNPTPTPTPTVPPTGGIAFEAESVARTESGTGTTVQNDAAASGGQWISLDAEATGSWIEFTTPSLNSGTYELRMRYKTNNNRGQLSASVAGVPVGGTIDQYGSTSYPEVNLGPVNIPFSGTHKVRLTVVGKNSASSNYVLSADKFTLTEISGGTPTPTPTPTLTPTATPTATPTPTLTPTPTTEPTVPPTPTPTPTGAPTALAFEAESLAVTSSGAATALQNDANTSGGHWLALNATATGPWMEFTLPNVPAGTYTLKMAYKTNNNRGRLDVQVDGAIVGGVIDQYASPSTYPTATLGTVTFAAAGSHTVRLRVTGKNSASSSYVLSADRFLLN